MYDIVTQPIDVASVAAAAAHPSTGATVTFVGTTRDHNEGRRVTRLEYEAYTDMALAEMRKIGELARQRWPDRAHRHHAPYRASSRSAKRVWSPRFLPATAASPSRPVTSPSTG